MDRVAELFAARRPHQHAGAGLAADGGRGGGARAAAATMTVATGDAAPQNRGEPLYLRRALGGGAAPVYGRQSRHDRRHGARCRSPACRKADLPAESSGYTVSRDVYSRDGTPADLRRRGRAMSVRRGHQGHAHRRGARRAHAWSSICCRPGSRSRRATAIGGQVAGGLFLAQGARPTPPIPRRATTAMSRARPDGGRQGFHARLCRARGHAG